MDDLRFAALWGLQTTRRSYSVCVPWLVRDIPVRLPAVAVKGGQARSHDGGSRQAPRSKCCARARKQTAMTVLTIGGARCSWRASRNKVSIDSAIYSSSISLSATY
jgi:hypothetical protein